MTLAAALLGLLLCLALTGASGPLARGTDLAKPPPAPLGIPRAYGLPTFLSSAQLNNAKTIARLDEVSLATRFHLHKAYMGASGANLLIVLRSFDSVQHR